MEKGLDLIISRLPHRVYKSPLGENIRAFRTKCPVCNGHGWPLSLAENGDGLLLINCFAGCNRESILASIGLDWSQVLPDKPGWHRKKGISPDKWGSLMSAVDALFQAHVDLLAICSPYMDIPELENALEAILHAGERMEMVKKMAKNAIRGGAK